MLRSHCCQIALYALLLAPSLGAMGGIQSSFLQNTLTTSVSAYGTVGAVFSDSDSFGFRRNISSSAAAFKGSPEMLVDSQFNIQLSAHYQSWLQASLQFKIRDQNNNDDVDDYLPLAYLNVKPNSRLSIRGGRLPIDVFMLSESRDVSYAYPWARQINLFYGLFELDSFEGMDASYRHQLGKGNMEWRVAGGDFYAHISPSDNAFIRSHSKPFYSGVVQYDQQPWRWRFSYLHTEISSFRFLYGEYQLSENLIKLLPDLGADTLSVLNSSSMLGSKLQQYAVGFSYEDYQWQFQTEAFSVKFIGENVMDFASGYISIARRIGEWTPYFATARLYSAGRPQTNALLDSFTDHQISAIAPLAAMISSKINQSVLITGVRWDFSSKMALKLQWNHSITGDRGAYMWQIKPNQKIDRHINSWSLSLDFIF